MENAKRAFLAISIAAMIAAIVILAWRGAYFVMAALIAGTLIITCRVWHCLPS